MVARDLSPNTWEPEVHARPMWPLLRSCLKKQNKNKQKNPKTPQKQKTPLKVCVKSNM